jgi:hypothetical protein
MVGRAAAWAIVAGVVAASSGAGAYLVWLSTHGAPAASGPTCGPPPGSLGPWGPSLGAASEQEVGGHYWLNFTVTSANGNLVAGDVMFSVEDASGRNLTAAQDWAVHLYGPTHAVVASYSFVTHQWGTGATEPLVSGMTVSLYSGSTDLTRAGNSLALWITDGSCGGSVTAAIP